MPRLLIFAPCENVLISQGSSASLIVILHRIDLSGDIPEPIPENTATQMKWHIFAQWETEPEETGVKFEQKIEMSSKDGTMVPSIAGIAEFVPEAGKPVHRMIVNLTFFPIIPAGFYRLRLSLRRSDQQGEWIPHGDYPLEISYQHRPAAVHST